MLEAEKLQLGQFSNEEYSSFSAKVSDIYLGLSYVANDSHCVIINLSQVTVRKKKTYFKPPDQLKRAPSDFSCI